MKKTFLQFWANSERRVGAIAIAFLLAVAFLTPLFHPYDIALQDLSATLQAPSAKHPLGTDHLGRDMLARLASALRLSFFLTIGSVGLAFVAGLGCGLLAGIFGGWIDRFFGVVCDCLMALPGLIFILLFAAIAPDNFWSLYLGVSLVMWVEFFKMSRAMSAHLRQSDEIKVASLMDMGLWYTVKRHYLPRLLPVLATLCAFGSANAVLALATLGFVNVGFRPPKAELGLMMTELFPYYYEAPFVFFLPIVAVFVMALGFHLLAAPTKTALEDTL